MVRFVKILGFAVIFTALVVNFVVSGEKENLWTKFNVGSWVLYELGGTGMQQKQTLIEKNDKEITLRMETLKDGQPFFSSDIKVPLDAPETQASMPPEKVGYDLKNSNEIVQVKNETLTCQITEVTTEKGTGKNWVCDKVPGGLVRSEINGNLVLRLLEFEAK